MRPKTDLFPTDLAELAAFAKALSHPARLAILQTLAERGTCICGEVVDVLPLAQASVSRHLKALQEAGLIRGETDGPRSCYCLDADVFARLADAFKSFADEVREGTAGEDTDDADCC
jgi:ArsR family transcriptional regulator